MQNFAQSDSNLKYVLPNLFHILFQCIVQMIVACNAMLQRLMFVMISLTGKSHCTSIGYRTCGTRWLAWQLPSLWVWWSASLQTPTAWRMLTQTCWPRSYTGSYPPRVNTLNSTLTSRWATWTSPSFIFSDLNWVILVKCEAYPMISSWLDRYISWFKISTQEDSVELSLIIWRWHIIVVLPLFVTYF